METLAPDVAAEYARRAEAVRERAASTFTRGWPLTGEKSICPKGGNATVRLLPRWDFADSIIRVDGKAAPNPEYRPRVAFQRAFEHWFENTSGKKQREYCPKSLDPMVAEGVKGEIIIATSKIRCSVCLASLVLKSGGKEEKEQGKSIRAQEIFIFNAVVGSPRLLNDSKLVDIRPIACPGSIYGDISDIITGGTAGPKFARGNITSPAEGYDLSFRRPSGRGTGEQWSVVCEPTPSMLSEKEQFGVFKDWVKRLTNLEEMVKKETKTEDGIFEAYYGRKPEAGEMDKLFAPVIGRVVAGQTAGTVPVPTTPNFLKPEPQQPVATTPVQEPQEAEGSNDEPDEFMGLMPPGASGKAPRR
jgi:hypothetical protein